jgi:hypothetical protein
MAQGIKPARPRGRPRTLPDGAHRTMLIIPPEEDLWLRHEAAANRCTVADIVRRLIAEAMKRAAKKARA